MTDTNDMPRYRGTKQLRAKSMTRGEYVAYRGWQLPDGENENDPGYLVEYEGGGTPNDSRHAGYISWSPADVFERSYRLVETHTDRIRAELADLSENISRLTSFSGSETFVQLSRESKQLLRDQLNLMVRYQTVLRQRLALESA